MINSNECKQNMKGTYTLKGSLQVSPLIVDFIEHEVLPELDVKVDEFWSSFSSIVMDLTPINHALLIKRAEMQTKLDEWNKVNRNNFNARVYKAFLYKIGYLVPEKEAFSITTTNVDDEVARQAGPQLVVPASNARFALNATNARWGSLYDALYGTDAIADEGDAGRQGDYNPLRGVKVIKFGRKVLDEHFELVKGSHGSHQLLHS